MLRFRASSGKMVGCWLVPVIAFLLQRHSTCSAAVTLATSPLSMSNEVSRGTVDRLGQRAPQKIWDLDFPGVHERIWELTRSAGARQC